MSPTWLEIAVAFVLLWVAWRIGFLLTPWLIARWRAKRLEPRSSTSDDRRSEKPERLTNRKD